MMSQALAVVPVEAGQESHADTTVAVERAQPKAIKSRVLDHVGPYLRLMQARLASPHVRQVTALQPVFASSLELLPPCAYPELPASSVGTKFVTTSFFRHRAAINHLVYTPDGRRLLCGGNNGNVSLWNGTNFDNELGPGIQAHEASPIRCMVFSHSGLFLLSCDDAGRVKFSRPTLEVLQVYQAHKEPCRAVSFSPTDYKFATGSDDSTVRVFDTFRGQECSMTGHGGDVRWVDWHPTKGVIASCSKDACVKLWDPRAAAAGCLSTLHGHKNGVFQVKWNRNGHWLLSCSRDQLVKLYDVRMLKEVASFAGHGRDVACVAWHPQHEELFVSGAVDGSLMMWLASRPDAQGCLPAAHEAAVWSAAWHPLGHVLASAGADNKCQFWCRKRPGDIFADAFDAASTAAPGGSAASATAASGVGASLGDAVGLAAGSTAGGGSGGMFGLGPGASLLGPGPGGTAGAAAAAAGMFGGQLSGPGAAAAPGAAVSRPHVIPGIGAALEGLTTANLQGLIAASHVGAGAGEAAGAGSAGGSGGSSMAAGAGSRGGMGTSSGKRGREDFPPPRPAPNRYFGGDAAAGGSEKEREREFGRGDRDRDRGERDRERPLERGPPKLPRMDGGMQPGRADRGGPGMHMHMHNMHNMGRPGFDAEPGFGHAPPHAGPPPLDHRPPQHGGGWRPTPGPGGAPPRGFNEPGPGLRGPRGGMEPRGGPGPGPGSFPARGGFGQAPPRGYAVDGLQRDAGDGPGFGPTAGFGGQQGHRPDGYFSPPPSGMGLGPGRGQPHPVPRGGGPGRARGRGRPPPPGFR
ncbi:hypothetical protein HYH02_011256 [Chlamydomonas schloesseri]|uniref:Uncharacterized protein n=1 Tax=Chlamydomonas schloesseri TaxID=2026947 RepID=A0A835T284_9CHLO|nr:hypothetical protein HYH02_011256 [Chlamydomonas schloesseri]|eukprot:KAG2437617.1 hypothetical protein HYH02_011256 [Chlamydomonas schloesseri]